MKRFARTLDGRVSRDVAPHAFVLDERLLAPMNRIKCRECGLHVLNGVHGRLAQAELDRVAAGLWYPTKLASESAA